MNQRGVQFERNRASQSAWLEFSHHRNRVMSRIRKSMEKFDQPSLSILGAGNCNDLDLRECLENCRQVTLIDFDVEAMKVATIRQKVESHSRLQLVTMDLSDPSPVSRDVETSNIVVSTCLLSQLIESAVSQPGPGSNSLNQTAVNASDQHIRCMTDMLAPGGIGLLISDFVSSDTIQDIRNVPDNQVPTIAQKCLIEGNFFSGTNPFPIRLKMESEFGLQVNIVSPWRWRLGTRAFLVYALEFQST